MMVEVAPAPNAQTVKISNATVFRNMVFDHLSTKQWPAQISIKGLQAKAGFAMNRDVYLQVITRNMPALGDWPFFLNSQFMNALKRALLGFVQAVNSFALSLSLDDQMKVVWPTYEVHAYYDTGRSTIIGGKRQPILSPMNSFGYYLSHDGVLFGYSHAIGSETDIGLKTLSASSLYKVRVPNEGSVRIMTGVTAEEVPKSWTGWWSSRACQLWSWACE